MNKYLLMLPRNLGNICFGSWLIGMGLIHYLQPTGGAVYAINVVMGILLVLTGVCSLIGR